MLVLTTIVPDCPVPLTVIPEDVRVNQLALDVTLVFQATGHSQPPHAVNMTVCAAGLADAPCATLKERALDEGGEIVQGGCTTRFTAMTCGLPGARLPSASIPLSVI